MNTIPLSEILPVITDKKSVIEAVKSGLMAHARREVMSPTPLQMIFSGSSDVLKGDCHIKTAHSPSYPYFCIKVASGFYGNNDKGIPVNNGLVLLLSSETGEPLALFEDQGKMTSARTGAAGALAVSLRSYSQPIRLGIVGTGHQAENQARWITFHNPISEIHIWGRSAEKAADLVERLGGIGVAVNAAEERTQLCQNADVIVTTTPSTSPILSADDVEDRHHIIALGSDSPGKVELDPKILNRAASVILDDHQQCLAHGEFGYAVNAGTIESNRFRLLGTCLASPETSLFSSRGLSVVDLTGVGAQDLALSALIWERLNQ